MVTTHREWVCDDSARNALFQQGYLVERRENRRGAKWLLMRKDVRVPDEPAAEEAAKPAG